MPKKIIELFAGVGGFRIGFEKANELLPKQNSYEVVWSNQWEPNEKGQHASKVYVARWGSENHSNEDIANVSVKDIPDADILVGGFPCQDYSVARTLNQAHGIAGKKGVLWWEIQRILEAKRPQTIILENVDRLLGSPANQRGRDFAIILASLNDLGYAVEWRIINASEYGMPQRRKRIFIVGIHSSNKIFEKLKSKPEDWLTKNGIISRAFPVKNFENMTYLFPSFKINGDLAQITESFNSTTPNKSPFCNSGISLNREVLTIKTYADYEGNFVSLGNIILEENAIPKEYFIEEYDLPKWQYLKGAKKLTRVKKNGVTYSYDEGPVGFPDALDKASRTIITGEGGKSPSRFKHVVLTKSGKYRRLTPIELERLNGFPDNHTLINSVTAARRAFFMGNALVTGIVTRLAISINEVETIENENYSTVTDFAKLRG